MTGPGFCRSRAEWPVASAAVLRVRPGHKQPSGVSVPGGGMGTLCTAPSTLSCAGGRTLAGLLGDTAPAPRACADTTPWAGLPGSVQAAGRTLVLRTRLQTVGSRC